MGADSHLRYLTQNTEVFVDRLHVRVSKTDKVLVKWLAEYYETSGSDVIRTAIRMFANQTANMEKKVGRRSDD